MITHLYKEYEHLEFICECDELADEEPDYGRYALQLAYIFYMVGLMELEYDE